MPDGAIERRRIRRAFSRRLGGGDLTAEVAARLMSRLDEIAPQPQWIVDVGGDGGAMRERFPKARILAADIALPRLIPQPRVFRAQAEAAQLPMRDAAANMVWSNLCLEWTDIRQSLSEAARVLRPHSGLLIFSVLGRDTMHEARTAFGAANAKDAAPHLMDMHDIGDMLGACGFSETVMETERAILTYRAPEDAMREVRRAGGGAPHPKRLGLFGRRRWRRAMDEYARLFADADGRVPATYEIIYAISWRKSSAPPENVIRFAEK